MDVLVINCGSSSQSFKILREVPGEEPVSIASGKARNVATKTKATPVIDWNINGKKGSLTLELPSHRKAAQIIAAILRQNCLQIDAIGHRFVHGAELFTKTARIDPTAIENLQKCLHFAPIHNPNSYSVIDACLELYPGIPQYVVFDTAFHAALPEAARNYALPAELVERFGYRKYGFHGLSYQYVSDRTAELIGRPLEALKLIICHLGTGGASVAALKNGLPLDTSMGYSPLPGLVMSTRSGDIDPEIILEMVRNGFSAEQIGSILNNQSGLIGLSKYSSNLEEIIEAAENGDEKCKLAFEVYAWRLRFYLGAYSWLLNGADAIVFTDDVGMKCWQLREKVCRDAENLGIKIDLEHNKKAPTDQPAQIHHIDSKVQLWVIPTDEEIVIFKEVLAAS